MTSNNKNALLAIALAVATAYALPARATGSDHKPPKPTRPAVSQPHLNTNVGVGIGIHTSSNSSAGAAARAAATSGSSSGSMSGGNVQSVTVTSPENQTVTTNGVQRVITEGGTTTNFSGEYKIKNAPSVTAPNLTSSNDTCMGSVSIGGSGVGFGLSLGSTWTDSNCVMLKNSRELWNMGMREAALARMCMDSLNREALEISGFVCPTRRSAEPVATPATAPVMVGGAQ